MRARREAGNEAMWRKYLPGARCDAHSFGPKLGNGLNAWDESARTQAQVLRQAQTRRRRRRRAGEAHAEARHSSQRRHSA